MVGAADAPIDSKTNAYLQTYDHAQSVYAVGLFREAAIQFESCRELKPGDLLTEVYLRRCRKLIEHPPREAWTGVHVAEHK